MALDSKVAAELYVRAITAATCAEMRAVPNPAATELSLAERKRLEAPLFDPVLHAIERLVGPLGGIDDIEPGRIELSREALIDAFAAARGLESFYARTGAHFSLVQFSADPVVELSLQWFEAVDPALDRCENGERATILSGLVGHHARAVPMKWCDETLSSDLHFDVAAIILLLLHRNRVEPEQLWAKATSAVERGASTAVLLNVAEFARPPAARGVLESVANGDDPDRAAWAREILRRYH